jgi:GTP cyclohydrolase IA
MGLQAFVLAISLVDCLSWSGVVSTDCPLKLAAEPCLWPSPRQPNRRTQANMSVSTSGDAPSFDHGSLTGELDDTPSTERDVPVDLPRIERAVREILAAVGEDPDREGLRETPARVARMYRELFSGLHTDPRVHLQKFFTEKYDEMVLVKDIAFNSMCEHHMLPFIGKAHIGYIPSGKVVGLSKLARVVEEVSHRPQVQERMASHSCMAIRGVRKPESICVTSAMKGIFRSNLSSRSEVMQLIYGERR